MDRAKDTGMPTADSVLHDMDMGKPEMHQMVVDQPDMDSMEGMDMPDMDDMGARDMDDMEGMDIDNMDMGKLMEQLNESLKEHGMGAWHEDMGMEDNAEEFAKVFGEIMKEQEL